jgi:hypothetical protein
MNKLSDEILNKYLDGEIDTSELADIKNELDNNPETVSRLRALKCVDDSLRHMETEPAPHNFTGRVMKAISAAQNSARPAANYFFRMVVAIFTGGVIAVLIAAFKITETGDGKSVIAPYSDKLKDAVNKNITSSQSFFSDPAVVLTISAFSLILLIAAYFTFESHKNFTKKLNSVTH